MDDTRGPSIFDTIKEKKLNYRCVLRVDAKVCSSKTKCCSERRTPAFGDLLYHDVRETKLRLHTVDADSEHGAKSLTRQNEPEPATAGQGISRRSHRLERDILLVLGREDLRVTVAIE